MDETVDETVDETLDENAAPAALFEGRRPHLRAVAYRLLGSFEEADEAVEDVRRTGRARDARIAPGPVPTTDDPTAAVARACLARLRSRETHREHPWDPWASGGPPHADDHADHADHAEDARDRAGEPRGTAPALGPGRADPTGTARVRPARRVLRPVRGDRPDRGAHPGRHPPAHAAGPATGSRRPRRCRSRTCHASGRSSRPS